MQPGQSYVERAPVAALAPFVRTVWVQRTGSGPYAQRNLPTGGVELHGPLGAAPYVVGPLTAAHVRVLPPHTTVVGARLWPGVGSWLVGLPADEVLDLVVSLAELWGAAGAARLTDRLGAAPDDDAALTALQHHLVERSRRHRPDDPLAVHAARRLMPWRPVGVGELSGELAISGSQLRRRLTSAVGVAPKVLQRTLRFQGYLALAQAAARRPGRERVADLAAAAGYADHAHLTRECVRLTGLTPRVLLGGRDDRCGCGHDHAASYRPFLAGYRPVDRPEVARSVQERGTHGP